MIQVIILIAFIAIVGCIVAFITTLNIPAIFKNLIYLIMTIAVLLYIIHALQSGHLPSVRL